jgi:acyl-CoA thioester hydrolase
MTSTHFSWPLRVYYEDTDAGGIVFYANYLRFFERARTEWLRAIGIQQNALAASHGMLFVVKSAAIDYHASAKLDDELKLVVVVQHIGRASVQFLQEAWCMTEGAPILLTTANVKIACVDSASLRPCSMPDDILLKIKSGH